LSEIVRRGDDNGQLPQEFQNESVEVQSEVLYRVRYQGYMAREQRQIEKFAHIEKIQIPAALDFRRISGLRKESAIKLTEIRPSTLGQASRISGVNPADISILMVIIESTRRANECK
jgi:tRNA uridine 5-carboxymethylaminomethyl modification enzyme